MNTVSRVDVALKTVLAHFRVVPLPTPLATDRPVGVHPTETIYEPYLKCVAHLHVECVFCFH